MENQKKIVGMAIGAIITVMILIVPIYYFMAFESVGFNEYALRKDTISNNIEETVYEKGLYDLGLFGTFIKFPKTVQSIEFFTPEEGQLRTDSYSPLDSRSLDGLLLQFQVSFQYRLTKENLYILYQTFGSNYEERFVGQARTTLRDAASVFKAIDFFNNRTEVSIYMKNLLARDLATMYVEVAYFQLREIDLPDSFEDALERVQVAQQEYEIALFEQQAELVKAQTEIFRAQAQANITVISANATAEAFLINMRAQAEAVNITLAAESEAYYAMSQQLNLTNTELLALLWIMAILEHDEAMLIIGIDTPIILPTTTNSTLMLQ